MKRFQDGLTWLAQIVMFLILGLLATPSEFGAILLPAIALAAFLIFVARPFAVWLCLLPFDFQRREGGLHLLGRPARRGLDPARHRAADRRPRRRPVFFNTAFIIVLASLLVQGWTMGLVARRLGLVVPPRIGPIEKVELELPGTANHELLSYRVVPDSPVARGERIPRWARPSLVIRDGQSMRYQYAGRLRAGDYVYLFISPRYPPLLDRLFASPAPVSPDDAEFFGEFAVDPAPRAPAALPLPTAVRLHRTRRRFVDLADDDRAARWPRPNMATASPLRPVELIVREIGDRRRTWSAPACRWSRSSGRGGQIPLFLSLRDVGAGARGSRPAQDRLTRGSENR